MFQQLLNQKLKNLVVLFLVRTSPSSASTNNLGPQSESQNALAPLNEVSAGEGI